MGHKGVAAAVVLLLLAIVSITIDPRPSTGAAPDRDVRVINTTAEAVPTRAQGTTAVTGTVGISGTVLTRDVENPAHQPFHARGVFSMGSGEPDQGVTVAIPAGKHFVVEHVSAFLGVPDGQKVLFSVGTRVSGTLQFHALVAHEQGVFPQILGLGAKAAFTASQSLRAYGDPGTQVFMSVARTSTDGTAAGEMDVAGHLVDAQ